MPNSPFNVVLEVIDAENRTTSYLTVAEPVADELGPELLFDDAFAEEFKRCTESLAEKRLPNRQCVAFVTREPGVNDSADINDLSGEYLFVYTNPITQEIIEQHRMLVVNLRHL